MWKEEGWRLTSWHMSDNHEKGFVPLETHTSVERELLGTIFQPIIVVTIRPDLTALSKNHRRMKLCA